MNIRYGLLFKIAGLRSVHEFHVWRLAGQRIVASAHITCENVDDYLRIAEEVKTFFHDEGIHSTTVQPEFMVVSIFLNKFIKFIYLFYFRTLFISAIKLQVNLRNKGRFE